MKFLTQKYIRSSNKKYKNKKIADFQNHVRQMKTQIFILQFLWNFHRINLEYNAVILILAYFWYDNMNATEFLIKLVIFINIRCRQYLPIDTAPILLFDEKHLISNRR